MSLPEVLAELDRAAREAGRAPESVRLVAVTKGQSLETIRERVLAYGPFPLAENRGQELRDKVAQAQAEGLYDGDQGPPPEWHFIGPIQRNKVKYLGAVSLIHSLTETWQAEALARAGEGWGRVPDVLLQVHNGEAQKQGAPPEALGELRRGVEATGVRVRGLMVMAPEGDPEAARRVFTGVAARAHDLGLSELSMGMSQDYALAVEAGSTLVRVGRKLFS